MHLSRIVIHTILVLNIFDILFLNSFFSILELYFRSPPAFSSAASWLFCDVTITNTNIIPNRVTAIVGILKYAAKINPIKKYGDIFFVITIWSKSANPTAGKRFAEAAKPLIIYFWNCIYCSFHCCTSCKDANKSISKIQLQNRWKQNPL